MAAKIEEFLSYFSKQDVARDNQYQVNITIPPILSGANVIGGLLPEISRSDLMSFARVIPLMASSITVPGLNNTGELATVMAPRVETPHSSSFGTSVAINFLQDQQFNSKKFFDTWAYEIGARPGLKYEQRFVQDIVSTITVEFLDRQEGVTYGYRFLDAYPTTVSPFNVKFAERGNTLDLLITFKFSRFELLFPGEYR